MTQQNHIKDISLAQWGRNEIQLAQVQMPGLMSCRKQYQGKNVLQGSRVSGSLHMTIQTAVLIQTLHALGAKVRWCSCNIYSTQDQAAAAIVKNKTANVFAWKGMSIEDYWQNTLKCLVWPGNVGPTSIVDDGGDATLFLTYGLQWQIQFEKSGKLPEPQRFKTQDQRWLFTIIKRQIQKDKKFFSRMTKDLIGVSQQTTTGVKRLAQFHKQNRLICPSINVNDSVTKSKFDNLYGCKHSLIDGLNRAVDLMLAGKRCLVFGYGDVGKGCAHALRGAGAVVHIAQIDPICALQACMQGYRVVRKQKVIGDIDVFITATGNKQIIMLQDMKKMKNNAVVCNIGHFDNQIDMYNLSADKSIKKKNIKPQVDRYVFQDGHGVIILAQGRLMNLGCATGHPSFVMSNSFTNQMMAQIQLWTNRATGKYVKQLYKLPKQLDQKVARLHLGSLGAELTILTQSQAQYIHTKVQGPFKQDQYRY